MGRGHFSLSGVSQEQRNGICLIKNAEATLTLRWHFQSHCHAVCETILPCSIGGVRAVAIIMWPPLENGHLTEGTFC